MMVRNSPPVSWLVQMQSSDIQRIDSQAQRPRLLTLYFALQRLRSVVSFMNSGAHPDDETSALLAALGFQLGLDISFACANRGEGGQNDIGTETAGALGTLRTAEMERAAAALDMRLYWLSTHPGDSIIDFRFSKSGLETLDKWGHQHSLERFVSIIRREKPDILCPTFLDVPGQHGHHRAMTQLAHEAITAAADDSFRAFHGNEALAPWSVTKLYLPAWSGAGSSYDDEVPPPPATLTVEADGIDELTGWSWEQLGQQSRRFHLSQGMGRWIKAGAERNWPLHLAFSKFNGPDNTLTDHLPQNLGELTEFTQADAIATHLGSAQMAIDNSIAAFPNYAEILASANSALRSIQLAQKHCPENAAQQLQHRLNRKVEQLARVIRIASGLTVHAVSSSNRMRPGEHTQIEWEIRPPVEQNSLPISYSVALTHNKDWSVHGDKLEANRDADPTDPYPAEYFPDKPGTPAVSVQMEIDGVESTTSVELVNPPVILPERSINLSSQSIICNRRSNKRTFTIDIHKCVPNSASVSLQCPDGWRTTATKERLNITLPAQIETGTYTLDVLLDDYPGKAEQLIVYPHIATRVVVSDARITVLVLDVELPKTRIAYIGGGNDRIAEHATAMGLELIELGDDALKSASELDQFDTLLVGVFAMRSRPALMQNIQLIHDWINKGGHLVTLYHRPWDNWQPESTPPRFLEIGQPSLRYRITDENAVVTHLLPEHPLLNRPNDITTADWQGWQKERGLYFAKTWHDDYKALLSMHDPDEKPLTGGLLSAQIGKGRHTHTALNLHHQTAKLVPGSFRLLANLLN